MTMAQTSWPFENIDTTETQFSQWARHIGEGVIKGVADELEPFADSTGMFVKVKTGQALIRGHYYNNGAEVTLTVPLADLADPRIDSIVLRLDPVANSVVLALVEGTPDSSPVAPTLTQTDGEIYELRIANIAVATATANIAPEDVTDTRELFALVNGEALQAAAPITYDPDNQEFGIDQSGLTLAQSQVTGLTAGTSGFTALSAGTAGISYQPVSHNYIMNGAFDVNQREFASATTTGYGFDRWLNSAVGDGTTTFTAESFTPGDAPVLGQESRNFLRVVSTGQTSSNTASVTEQRVEDVRTITPGTTWTVSFYARAATGSPKVATEFAQSFGAGGSAGVNTFIGQVTLTNSWQRFTQTVFLPTIAGKTVGLNSFTFLRFYFSAGSDRNDRTGSLGIQSNTFDIWGVQLEAGSVATPFKRHAPSLQGELAACQRYYVRGTATGASASRLFHNSGAYTSTTNAFIGVGFPVELRVAPTSVDVGGNLGLWEFPNDRTVTALALTSGVATTKQCYLTVTVASGGVAGKFVHLEALGDASAFIAFPAEL